MIIIKECVVASFVQSETDGYVQGMMKLIQIHADHLPPTVYFIICCLPSLPPCRDRTVN